MGHEPIPRDVLDAVGHYTRFIMLAEMNRAFAESGLTIEQVANRLGWKPQRVRAFLAGRTKVKIGKVGETAFAIDGSMVSFRLSPKPKETDND